MKPKIPRNEFEFRAIKEKKRRAIIAQDNSRSYFQRPGHISLRDRNHKKHHKRMTRIGILPTRGNVYSDPRRSIAWGISKAVRVRPEQLHGIVIVRDGDGNIIRRIDPITRETIKEKDGA